MEVVYHTLYLYADMTDSPDGFLAPNNSGNAITPSLECYNSENVL